MYIPLSRRICFLGRVWSGWDTPGREEGGLGIVKGNTRSPLIADGGVPLSECLVPERDERSERRRRQKETQIK